MRILFFLPAVTLTQLHLLRTIVVVFKRCKNSDNISHLFSQIKKIEFSMEIYVVHLLFQTFDFKNIRFRLCIMKFGTLLKEIYKKKYALDSVLQHLDF